MKTGMLWQYESAGSGKTAAVQLEQLLHRAAEDYQRFYGVTPSVCYLNPRELGNHRRRLQGLDLQLSPSEELAPGQLWLGQ
jgi:hypothetical protein